MTRQLPHESPLERFLLDPHRPLPHIARELAPGERALEHATRFAPLIGGVLLGLVVIGVVLARVRGDRDRSAARLVTLAVPPEVEPDAAQLLWAGLHDLLRPRLAQLIHGQPQLAWEITAGRAGTSFRLWIPAGVPPGLVERAVTAAWPGITTTSSDAEADNRARDHWERLIATELVLSGPGWFPLGGQDDPDPLRLLLGQLSGLAADEHVLVQIVAQPVSWRQQARLLTATRRLRAGASMSRLAHLREFVVATPRSTRPPDPTVSPDVRAVLEKASHPLYRCLIRVAVTGPDRQATRGRIHAVAGAFAAYEGRVGLRRRHTHHPRSSLSQRALGRRGFLLSVPELARLAHLPADTLPGVQRAGARAVPAPPGLAADGKPLGLAGDGGRVFLGVSDSRYHIHLLGPTGVGKSTLIAMLALADLAAGRGAVVIDPKGDLIEDLLARIPAGLEDRVDLLDPLDPAPPGLNVLEGEDPDLVVDQLVGIFRRVFERFWGPRTDDILRSSLLTLMQDPEASLADVPRLLGTDEWRRGLVDRADDPVGLGSFWAWYDSLGEATRAQATGPVLNKLRTFLLRRSVRAIVGQQHSTIDMREVLDEGRLLLVRVPKGTLGEDTSRLLGSFVVARVWQAALARAGRPEVWRPDCALYIDEVHNYLSLPTPIGDMLAEARGYRLSLCLAHQHLGQLPREMREAINANARSKLFFQLSPEDAHSLERLVAPEFAAHDLAHLPAYTAAARICRDGEAGAAFTLRTVPLPAGTAERAEAVRRVSRERSGTAREQVEERLARRQRQTVVESDPKQRQLLEQERRRRDSREELL